MTHPPERSCPHEKRAARSASGCTRADASSFPIRGTSARAQLSAGPGLQGAGDHQRGLCLVARASATAASRATMMLAHIAELSAAADVPMNADFEGGYADAPEGVAESVRLCVRDRRVGPVDRGLHRRPGQAALRLRPGGGAHEGGARGHRQGRRRRAADGAQRGLHPRPPRPRRDHPPAQGLSPSRRRLPLCAGHLHARADRARW